MCKIKAGPFEFKQTNDVLPATIVCFAMVRRSLTFTQVHGIIASTHVDPGAFSGAADAA
jgi:hypothetical protein